MSRIRLDHLEHLDRDGDGDLTVDELVSAAWDYYANPAEESVGNRMFGDIRTIKVPTPGAAQANWSGCWQRRETR